ncbi:MAG: radical SAM family heme chaperone HemW, partial [Acidimicrobiales bacterium]
MTDGARREFGYYVHVPFCAKRCDYCAFATWTDRDHLMSSYAEACVTEVRSAVASEGLPEATSVFFGGGTPSRLPAAMLTAILDAIPRSEGAEVTVECNPEDASAERFSAWRSAGVNRISLGAQSMVPTVLESLGRRHGTDSVVDAVDLAHRAGFESVSVDLIFGAAAETDDDWRTTLDAVLGIRTPPEHVSCYALTVEAGTALAGDESRHPDGDTQARRYEITDSVLSDAGYHWYEISNWAKPNHECRHNILYWRQGDYRGIGCAAHSHISGRRWWNIRTPERYIGAVGSGAPTVSGTDDVDAESREFEALALLVRTAEGVPGDCVPDDPALEGLIEKHGSRAVLTLRGRLLANEVAIRLVPHDVP